MRVVLLSHTQYKGSPFVIGSHHYARQLAQLGHEVTFVGLPLRPTRLAAAILRRDLPDARSLALQSDPSSDVRYVTPVTLGRKYSTSPTARSGVMWSTSPSMILKDARRKLRDVDLVVLDNPAHISLATWLRPRQIIYRPSDDYAAWARPMERAGVNRSEAWLLTHSTAVLPASQPVFDRIAVDHGEFSGFVLENGVDDVHFSRAHAVRAHRPPSDWRCAIYVGALDAARFSWDHVQRAAIRNPDCQILLVGPDGRSLRPPNLARNVEIMGAVPYAALPELMARCTVGLLPALDNPLNDARSPMKLYEYLAAGLRVVATSTTELRRRKENFVSLAASASEFGELLSEALGLGAVSPEQSSHATSAHSWSSNTSRLLSAVPLLGRG